ISIRNNGMATEVSLPHPASTKNSGIRHPTSQFLGTHVWAHPTVRMGIAIGIAALTGILMALVMPRGPATTNEALILMLTGFVTGLTAGFLQGSRWTMVIAPVVHQMV